MENLMDWSAIFDLFLDRSRRYIDDDGICRIKASWESTRFDLERAFEGQMKNFDRAVMDVEACRVREYAPIWWVPVKLPGRPDEWVIDDEIYTEDIWSDGTYGIPRGPLTTLITDRRMYLTFNGERFPIRSYYQTLIDGVANPLAAVLSPTPPPWGWWMPSLKEI